MIYSVDRFEGEYAILEQNSQWIHVRKDSLPPNVKEGDLLEFSGEWHILQEQTNFRKQLLAQRRKNLLKGNSS